MEPVGDRQAIRGFFASMPDRAFPGMRTTAGRTAGETFGNPDILNKPNRQRDFLDQQHLDGYLADTGLYTDDGSEYIFVVYHPDGSITLYIED